MAIKYKRPCTVNFNVSTEFFDGENRRIDVSYYVRKTKEIKRLCFFVNADKWDRFLQDALITVRSKLVSQLLTTGVIKQGASVNLVPTNNTYPYVLVTKPKTNIELGVKITTLPNQYCNQLSLFESKVEDYKELYSQWFVSDYWEDERLYSKGEMSVRWAVGAKYDYGGSRIDYVVIDTVKDGVAVLLIPERLIKGGYPITDQFYIHYIIKHLLKRGLIDNESKATLRSYQPVTTKGYIKLSRATEHLLSRIKSTVCCEPMRYSDTTTLLQIGANRVNMGAFTIIKAW